MKDLFGPCNLDSVEQYQVAIVDTPEHRYMCLLKEIPPNGTLLRYLEKSDYVIRDGELIKSKSS